MTKGVLERKLRSGELLSNIFMFSMGQCGCTIYKTGFFPDDEISYIPDLQLNGIPQNRAMNEEEIKDTIDCCYTGNDFIEQCGGDEELAAVLFAYCDWQHPSSSYPEVMEDDE